MLTAKCLLSNRQRSLCQRFGLPVFALYVIVIGYFIESSCKIGMFGAKCPLLNRQRTLVELFGLFEMA